MNLAFLSPPLVSRLDASFWIHPIEPTNMVHAQSYRINLFLIGAVIFALWNLRHPVFNSARLAKALVPTLLLVNLPRILAVFWCRISPQHPYFLKWAAFRCFLLLLWPKLASLPYQPQLFIWVSFCIWMSSRLLENLNTSDDHKSASTPRFDAALHHPSLGKWFTWYHILHHWHLWDLFPCFNSSNRIYYLINQIIL